mmetsp:Transcript_117597/g.312841  ORF Transcript_117597/g.312841 Transcript_117597/m.312841 type:complete len:507 (+) Transcript_117597:27-1547(+)
MRAGPRAEADSDADDALSMGDGVPLRDARALLLRGEPGLRGVALPLLGGALRGRWHRALVGESAVHPLPELGAVQRHGALVACGDGLKLLAESRRQLVRRRQRGRGRGADGRQQPRSGPDGRLDALLQVTAQGLALVQAADRVVLGGCNAVGGRKQVVRNPHRWLAVLRLVQDPILAEVVQGLRELVAWVLGLAMEVLVEHLPSALGARVRGSKVHERGLHLHALGVLPPAESERELPGDGQGCGEGEGAALAGGAEGLGRVVLQALPLGNGHLSASLHPAVAVDVREVVRMPVANEQEEGVQSLLERLLGVQEVVHGAPIEEVCTLQEGLGLGQQQVLNGGNGPDDVTEREATVGLVQIPQRLRQRGRLLAQHQRLVHVGEPGRQVWRRQAGKKPAMLLGKVAARDGREDLGGRDPAHGILGEGLVRGPHARLHRQQPLRRLALQHPLHLRLQGRLAHPRVAGVAAHHALGVRRAHCRAHEQGGHDKGRGGELDGHTGGTPRGLL